MFVLKLGIDPKYFLDEMESYEMAALSEYQYYKERESWEQSRQILWGICQTHSKKKLSSEDIIQFPWDETDRIRRQTVTKEESQRLNNKSVEVLDLLNKGY